MHLASTYRSNNQEKSRIYKTIQILNKYNIRKFEKQKYIYHSCSLKNIVYI